MTFSPDQHNLEIHQNREFWNKKAALRRAYSQFYREITARVDPAVSGLIVELGSGMGNVKEHIPQCITTDIFPNPWLDQVENAYSLSFNDGSVGHLILFDVWHHLQYPGTALAEFARVLGPGGKIIIFEPAMGLIGRFVFGRFHHEPLGLRDEIMWEGPSEVSIEDFPYYAAQGNASRIFDLERANFAERLRLWRLSEVKHFSGLSYVASGGFRGPQVWPTALFPLLDLTDSYLSKIRKLASRILVVLEKR
jgi:SAM-dependent methyltransferase